MSDTVTTPNSPDEAPARLPGFNADAHCPKCGADDISVSYRRSGYDCHSPRLCGMSQFDGEHHDRQCRRCGYGWAEAVLS